MLLLGPSDLKPEDGGAFSPVTPKWAASEGPVELPLGDKGREQGQVCMLVSEVRGIEISRGISILKRSTAGERQTERTKNHTGASLVFQCRVHFAMQGMWFDS